ncbi:MAG TPA: DNA-binding domain-containing protein [Steroidobacteraceae bacterium]|nr:DNA-binding domain-containing protein [Steroidobacteraceae bacterium]
MSLLTLQRNFAAWLTSGSAEMAAPFGEQARPGLAVYLNNYRSQLLSCLSTSFPVTRAWMGDTAFAAATATHIERVPPRSWTLDAYGHEFPETLRALHPADPDFTELAALERDLGEVFVGADSARFDPAALADIDWETAIIHFVPTLRLLSVTTNVVAIWSAIDALETPPAVVRLSEPATVAIWKAELSSRFRMLTRDEETAIGQLRAGRTFGAVCAALVERHGEEQGPVMAGSFLGRWLSDQMVARIGA